jgi:16S rRNA (uracil1498-N3)-methyltransferase
MTPDAGRPTPDAEPMNLILFNLDELAGGLDPQDPRVVHVQEVLRCGPEDEFDIGIVDGARGKARMAITDEGRAVFDYSMSSEPPALFPITLIIGMPRPQTARRLLREMTTIGVSRLWFAVTDRSDKGYAESKLWTTGEYRRHVRVGAEQAFCTRLPEIRRFESLPAALSELPPDGERTALDNYEATVSLSNWSSHSDYSILAIGAERGWSSAERGHLLSNGFELTHLGDRVLRVETAAVVATTILLEKRADR